MQLALEGMTTGFADTDPARLHASLSSSDRLRDELLGTHLYNSAPTEYMDHLDDKEDRCIEGAASAIKIVHHITSVILVDADDLKDDLVSKMTDKNGRWRPLRLDQAGSLLKELNQLDQHVLEIRGTGACKESEVDLTWLNAMKRLVSGLEDEVTLWRQFGDPLSKFKKDNPGYTAKMMRKHLTESATALFTKYGRTVKYEGKGGKGGKGKKGGKGGKSTFAACLQARCDLL